MIAIEYHEHVVVVRGPGDLLVLLNPEEAEELAAQLRDWAQRARTARATELVAAAPLGPSVLEGGVPGACADWTSRKSRK